MKQNGKERGLTAYQGLQEKKKRATTLGNMECVVNIWRLIEDRKVKVNMIRFACSHLPSSASQQYPHEQRFDMCTRLVH